MPPTLNALLKAMVEQGGSDLHVTTNSAPQIRVDGVLRPLNLPPLTPTETKQLCYSILTDNQKHRLEETLELDLSFGIKGLARFRANVFAAGDLAEMLSLCREGWEAQAQLHHEPVAIAWTRRGIDAYFFDGADSSSLRQIRCDAEGISRGPRVDHPLAAHLPAEAAAGRDDRVQGEWTAAIAHFSSRYFEPDDLAFELVLHPATGLPFSRRWRSGPESAISVVEPPDAPSFAFLPSTRFPGSAAPSLRALPRKRWLGDPASAFVLLAQELPKDAGISELTLEDDTIEVQIAWPTPAFDGSP